VAHIEKAPGIDSSEVTGVVFCGGLSRRMGQDKALLLSHGQTLLEKARCLLEPLVSRVVLSTGRAPRYVEMGLPCILDVEPDLGPIGGLQAALRASQTPWILALACDLPRLSEALVLELLGAAETGDLAVLFGSPANPEPLFALYRRELLPHVDAAIVLGRRRMTSFLESSEGSDPGKVRWLTMSAGSADQFANVNRPQDWHSYQRTVHPDDLAGDPNEEPKT
jgi:molybdopterin-guanine dinucleotide biosynthesis protein A